MSTLYSRAVILGLGLALVFPATADAKQRIEIMPDDPGKFGVELWGEYRLQASILSPFAVNPDGLEHGQTGVLTNRIRAGFGLQAQRFFFGTEWDFLSGQIAGDLWQIAGTVDDRHRYQYAAVTPNGAITPRRLSVGAKWASHGFEVGLVTSDWGLGMLANGGDRDPWFGQNEFGDRVVRARFTGRPLHSQAGHETPNALNVTGAFDLVLADDTTNLVDDQQLTLQGIFSVLWLEPKTARHGVYLVLRNQRELVEQTNTTVFVADGLADQWVDLGTSGGRLRIAAEGALIVGSTDRSTTYNSRDKLTVVSGAVTGLATVVAPGEKLRVHLRGGFATGDSQPDDGLSTGFTFDRDFDAGMVLFDQVLGAVDAATHVYLTDPENSGQPPAGVDATVREGAVGQTIFLQPVLEADPLDWLNLKAGVLFAVATAPVAQPFVSYRAGGVATNHHGEKPLSRALGTEINWAVRLGKALPLPGEAPPQVHLLVQGGHAILGDALVGGRDAVHNVLLTGRFRW